MSRFWLFCTSVTFFWHTIRFSQNDPFTEKRRSCQKKATLFQKSHNQLNFMLEIHLKGTSRHSMFYFFDLGPGFLTEILSFRIFLQILVKKRVLSRVLGYFGPFLADFRTSTLIFKYFGFSTPITCIYFLKALSLSFNLSYNSSMYHKNCGLNNFFTRLTAWGT